MISPTVVIEEEPVCLDPQTELKNQVSLLSISAIIQNDDMNEPEDGIIVTGYRPFGSCILPESSDIVWLTLESGPQGGSLSSYPTGESSHHKA